MKQIGLSTLIVLLALVSAGCGGFRPTQSPTPFPDWAYTQAAETVIAALTQNAPLSTPTSTMPPATPTSFATESPQPSGTPLPTETPPASQTPIPTASPTADTATLLYFEDFSGDSGWVAQSNENWGMGQADGGYFISVKISHAPIWSVRNQELANVRLEVDAAREAGSENGYFGLVCRHSNADNYYSLVIGSEGFFGIAIREGGEKLRFLVEGGDEAGIIQIGSAINHLRADCIGSTLALYANGQKLVEVEDTTFETGDTGLLAGTRKEPGLRVLFDDFALYSP